MLFQGEIFSSLDLGSRYSPPATKMCLYIENDDKTDKLLLFRKITKTVTTGKISLNKNLVLKSVHFLDAWPVLKKGKMWVCLGTKLS